MRLRSLLPALIVKLTGTMPGGSAGRTCWCIRLREHGARVRGGVDPVPVGDRRAARGTHPQSVRSRTREVEARVRKVKPISRVRENNADARVRTRRHPSGQLHVPALVENACVQRGHADLAAGGSGESEACRSACLVRDSGAAESRERPVSAEHQGPIQKVKSRG